MKLSLEAEFILTPVLKKEKKKKKGFGKQLQVPLCVYTLGQDQNTFLFFVPPHHPLHIHNSIVKGKI